MFKSYQDIFNQRGQQYHQAMLRYPLARQAEFKLILDHAEIAEGAVLLDMPSGGGYLGRFLDVPVQRISVETSCQFVRDVEPAPDHSILLCNDIAHTPLPDASADRIISLAGLHHLEDKLAFYRQAYRLLRPGGIFCVADAWEGSAVARFLNEFVHAHNSMGHSGVFLDGQTVSQLCTAGFELAYEHRHAYVWQFESPEHMADYCQLLFGIDQADRAAIIDGIQTYLGFSVVANACRMNWALHFLKARKPPA